MANQTTMIADLINPEVMADMISAKVEKKLVVAPFAKVDTTLQGIPGDTITIPQYAYIGDAEDIAEGVACGTVKPATSTTQAKVKKAMKAVELTDEAVLSGYGDPVGETNNQLALSIASKVDNDAMDSLQTAQLIFDGSAKTIAYAGIVDAIDLFEEEVNTEKVIFVHPKQVTQLRKDSDFISADKYAGNVIMTGEIGMIANARVVASKKVPVVKVSEVDCYACPIVKLQNDAETEEDAAALTVYLKRNTNVETERQTLSRKTDISVDKHYTVGLSNQSKVVLAKFKK
ncbi:N4-gp56 family major capsid protein [Eubacterium callanderi]|uniref:N4-gp56 family major capsid protein n=1 Tax=Eubacterium callanderi TaxID=53442 RepID=UPI001D063AB7|nr:N4-gp56 family major capsid protein [Eubacterium callanderi]MCB6660241.1 N4-gp56 family major capsid protein [Eubacterium callanderi]MCB6753184.1 N4-gp56 family major capsid protein [Eubacterium callanderi]MCB7105064.1 N4-gp56 family major capsid protein [Eubacterium callanderi]MCG4820593.1 N4-gp56 family major capsid protein [Eubacterium callanderi]MCQ5190467.1 N4-gp56 family major capsid protein [Eubacterium callanderi]